MPLPTLENSKVSKPSLQSFIRPMQNEIKHGFLSTKKTEEGFNPDAYKLMSRARYDFASSSKLENKDLGIIEETKHDLSETQKKIERAWLQSRPYKSWP